MVNINIMKNIKKKMAEYKKIVKEFNDFVEMSFPRGKLLKWVDGKYKGRVAKVDSAYWDVVNGEFKILVTVKTSRKDGNGYLDDLDYYHRVFREVDEYFDILESTFRT